MIELRSSVAREQDFHDEVYKNNPRRRLAAVYAAYGKSSAEYKDHLISIAKGKKMLEIGCGRGTQAILVAQAGGRAIGIDISPVAIDQAKTAATDASVTDSCSFITTDGSTLDFDSGSIDVVYGSGILHHLELDIFLKQIDGVLNDGGMGVFIEPLGHNVLINLFRNITPRLRSKDEHPLLVGDLRDMAKRFPDITFKYYHFLSLLVMPVALLPGGGWVVKLVSRLDDLLLKIIPWLSRYAWIVRINFVKHKGV